MRPAQQLREQSFPLFNRPPWQIFAVKLKQIERAKDRRC
jgi:hypothetical protein